MINLQDCKFYSIGYLSEYHAGSSEVEGGLQEMKDLSEQQNKRNWDSKNQQRRRRKKEKELKLKSKKGKKYRFASGSMTKSSW